MGYQQPQKDEVFRLRLQEKLGLQAISDKTGVSQGTLSRWLRDHPLDQDLVLQRMRENAKRSAVGMRKDRGQESGLHKTVRARNLNGVQVAKVSEAAILLRLLAQGFNVFGSVFDGDKADWFVEVPLNRKILKVQVKTAHQGKEGLPTVSLRFGINSKTGSRRYVKGDFDFLVGYDLFTDTAYVWSWDELGANKTTVSVAEQAREAWDKMSGV